MPLPTPLLRKNPRAYKNTFGHVLLLAGSQRLVGAAALTGLAAMRSGAGLVTLGIPKSLNTVVQKKIVPVIMTWPLPETSSRTLSPAAWQQVKAHTDTYQAIGIGPGLGHNPATRRFVHLVIAGSRCPLVIDADGLNALAGHTPWLLKTDAPKILTPHPGEMARLTGKKKSDIEANRKAAARDFVEKFRCVVVLKGHRTVVAAPGRRQVYVNTTGNVGMATAGSGDVLTGMITAFLGQGIEPFEAAKTGVYLHGRAGDLAAQEKGTVSLIATDIIDRIPDALGHSKKGLKE